MATSHCLGLDIVTVEAESGINQGNILHAAVSTCRLFRNIEQVQKLSELGVLFLLFEMGLELSLDRLKVSSSCHIP